MMYEHHHQGTIREAHREFHHKRRPFKSELLEEIFQSESSVKVDDFGGQFVF
jgi:hypothetical protein